MIYNFTRGLVIVFLRLFAITMPSYKIKNIIVNKKKQKIYIKNAILLVILYMPVCNIYFRIKSRPKLWVGDQL